MPTEAGIRRLLGATLKLDQSNRSDRNLLRQFTACHDESAFAALVKRHGNLVLGVCRRSLSNSHDAEDACQAVFLILAKKAESERWQSSIANWLYSTARRVSRNARRAVKSRARHEGRAGVAKPLTPLDQMSGRELLVALDDELEKLPGIYREPLVLHYLEGLSRNDVATRLGVRDGTIKIRLERGRKKLAEALRKRGIDVGAALIAVAATSAAAGSSPRLIESIVAGVASSPSAAVSAIANGIAVNGFPLQAKLLALAAVAATLTGLCAALMPAASPPDSKPQPAKAADAPPIVDQKPHAFRLDHFGDPLPDEALARFGTVRLRQGYIVYGISNSPDDKTIAIAGIGRRLGLWDVATGKELFQFDDGQRGKPNCNCIAFSPDGKTLAASGYRCLQLWNPRTGELISELKGSSAAALVFSSDGKTLIAAGESIRFWDIATGQETNKLEKQADSLALSSDGKLLASAGRDKIIRLWDLETRGLLKELNGRNEVGSLSFSPDSKRLVSAGYHQPCIVWDLSKDKPAHELGGEENFVEVAAFSPDGKWLAAGCNDGTIRLINPATAKEVRRWETEGTCVYRMIYSKDRKTIAANCSWECGVRFWDVETGKDKRPLDVHRSIVDAVKVSADGKSLWSLGRFDLRVIRWNAATAEPVEVVPIASKASLTLGRGALSPGGAHLAWRNTADKTMHVMDLKTRKDACEPIKTATEPISAQFSPDGKALAIACDASMLYMWKWQTQRSPKPLKTGPDGQRIVQQLFMPDGKRLVTRSSGGFYTLHLWDVETAEEVFSLSGANNALAITPDGKWAASSHENQPGEVGGRIDVIDLKTGKIVREIKLDTECGSTLALSPDGRVLALSNSLRESVQGSRGSDVKLIEFATGEPIAAFRGHHSGVFSFEFTPDGRILYSGGCDSTILKWDATARHGKARSTPNNEAAWQALAQEASKAYQASWDLVDEPKQAIELLRQRIKPAKKLEIKDVQPTVDMLDSDKFAAREKAAKDLQALEFSAEPILRKLLETEQRPEVKQRLQAALDRLTGHDLVRTRRALDALLTINSADGKRLLRELAAGADGNMLTSEAISRIDRFAPR